LHWTKNKVLNAPNSKAGSLLIISYFQDYKIREMRENNSLITKLIISSLSVFLADWLLPGVHIESFTTAIGVAIVLGILNATLKPLLLIVTIPLTLVTFGLFLFFINAIIIGVADSLIEGLTVRSVWTAMLFSALTSGISSLMYKSGKSQRT
jgi:putative membrane protein